MYSLLVLVVGSVVLFQSVAGDFASDVLAAHNKFRKIHDAGPLKINKEMSAAAKKWAEKLAKKGDLLIGSISNDEKYGQSNRYDCTDGRNSGKKAVTEFYKEVCDEDYFKNPGTFSSSTGHFTQLVWKDTKELGVGKAEVKKKGMMCTFITFYYKKPGNYRGKFKENVKKGKFDQSMCRDL